MCLVKSEEWEQTRATRSASLYATCSSNLLCYFRFLQLGVLDSNYDFIYAALQRHESQSLAVCMNKAVPVPNIDKTLLFSFKSYSNHFSAFMSLCANLSQPPVFQRTFEHLNSKCPKAIDEG